jgi:hypothetical protein
MIKRAEARIRKAGGGDRVFFICADARGFSPDAGHYDAVVTLFVLDCFIPQDVASVVMRMGAALSTEAPWIFSDFTLPPRGIARLRARAWLALLYAFFRWETALAVSSLPPSEEILEEAGWRRSETLGLQWGLLRSSVYRRPH